MSKHCLIVYPGLEQGPALAAVKGLPDLLKAHPEGLCRYPYLFATDQVAEARTGLVNGTLPVTGPFVATHAVRRAADLLLDEALYEGLNLQLEVGGRRLPELPGRAELEPLLRQEGTLVRVDDKPFKPATEVLGFQHVYDDTVRFIDGLKKLGIPQEALFLLATAEEISIEVHPGVFGLGEDPRVPRLFTGLLHHLGGLKRGDRTLVKTADRTLLLGSCRPTHSILVPGSVHPVLHRPKVGVGPSHFAYGIAAFSDFCGKKRTVEESLKELKAWLKFLEAEIAPLPKAKDLVTSLSPLETARPAAGPGQGAAVPTVATPAGGFQPFAAEVRAVPPAWAPPAGSLSLPWAELGRALGGGLAVPSLHVVAGAREEGKAALLLNLAAHAAAQASVLYISKEHDTYEFAGRLAAWAGKAALPELALKRTAAGADGEVARQQLAAGLAAALGGLGEHLFFRGCDGPIDVFDPDGLAELVKMLPDGRPRLLVLESLPAEAVAARAGYAARLRRLAHDLGAVFVLSLHTAPLPLPRPHLVEGPDLELLAAWQGVADSLVCLQSEKVNLKKFLAMSQGKVDPAVAEKLEAWFLQGAGGLRLKGDTYTLLRVLHARRGARQAILALFQREILRFVEGKAMPLGRA
ncbi:MAG: hypothetical protein GX442_18515 [Candidatus Riflebacteria bacterium]|nr:hypothetical protein [Candidatus Riflebacteria bacterium]